MRTFDIKTECFELVNPLKYKLEVVFQAHKPAHTHV